MSATKIYNALSNMTVAFAFVIGWLPLWWAGEALAGAWEKAKLEREVAAAAVQVWEPTGTPLSVPATRQN
jgi:hypothetical protein